MEHDCYFRQECSADADCCGFDTLQKDWNWQKAKCCSCCFFLFSLKKKLLCFKKPHFFLGLAKKKKLPKKYGIPNRQSNEE